MKNWKRFLALTLVVGMNLSLYGEAKAMDLERDDLSVVAETQTVVEQDVDDTVKDLAADEADEADETNGTVDEAGEADETADEVADEADGTDEAADEADETDEVADEADEADETDEVADEAEETEELAAEFYGLSLLSEGGAAEPELTGQAVYVYLNAAGTWFTVGKLEGVRLPKAGEMETSKDYYETYKDSIESALEEMEMELYKGNADLFAQGLPEGIDRTSLAVEGSGAAGYVSNGATWHLNFYADKVYVASFFLRVDREIGGEGQSNSANYLPVHKDGHVRGFVSGTKALAESDYGTVVKDLTSVEAAEEVKDRFQEVYNVISLEPAVDANELLRSSILSNYDVTEEQLAAGEAGVIWYASQYVGNCTCKYHVDGVLYNVETGKPIPYKCNLTVNHEYYVDYMEEQEVISRVLDSASTVRYTSEGEKTVAVKELENAPEGYRLESARMDGREVAQAAYAQGEGAELTLTYVRAESCGHGETKTQTTPATCGAEGEKRTLCAVCGKVLETETIQALGHAYGPWKDDGDGRTHTRVCGNDDSHTETETHAWGAWETVTAANDSRDGEEKRVCADCGGEDKRTLPRWERADDDDDDDDDRPGSKAVPTSVEETGDQGPVTQEPEEDLEETEVPLAGAPEEPEEELEETEVPLAGAPEEPEEDLEETEVPLTGAPQEPEEALAEEVPLADVPKTGDDLMVWLVLTAAAGCGLAALAFGKKEEEQE